jgi:hypothetical protein
LVLLDISATIITNLGNRPMMRAGTCQTDMTEKEQKEQILQQLQYMVAEGIAVETKPGYFRLKTERELEKEMRALYNE